MDDSFALALRAAGNGGAARDGRGEGEARPRPLPASDGAGDGTRAGNGGRGERRRREDRGEDGLEAAPAPCLVNPGKACRDRNMESQHAAAETPHSSLILFQF